MTNEELQLLSLPIIAAAAVSVFAYVGTMVVVRQEQKFQALRQASKAQAAKQTSPTDKLNPDVETVLAELQVAITRRAVHDILNDPDQALKEYNTIHG